MTVSQRSFGQTGGQSITAFTLENNNGFKVVCIDYGCIITEIIASDREARLENVVLGYDSLEEYEKDVHYLGAAIGRFAGRIQKGEFELAGKKVQVGQNSNGHHLHGGKKGFHSVIWDAKIIETDAASTVEFTYLSPDGEEGYPGNLEMTIRYAVQKDRDELVIAYFGKCDQPTLLNVTNHSYFNLSGNLKRDILDQELILASEEFLELDRELLPTGTLSSVENSIFDLRQGKKVREAVDAENSQTQLAGNGYDHPFILSKHAEPAATLKDVQSGRKLEVRTTEPAIVLYTGNGLGGPYTIRGTEARDNLGLCLETQGLPDSERHSHFGSSAIQAGEEFTSETKYLFGVIEE